MIAVRAALIVSIAVATTAPARAQDDPGSKPLTGTYYVEPAENPKTSADHIVMTITGDAAKSIWDAMKVKTQPDACIGRMARWINGLVCYGPAIDGSGPLGADESPFMCVLGVNLKNASLEFGEDC